MTAKKRILTILLAMIMMSSLLSETSMAVYGIGWNVPDLDLPTDCRITFDTRGGSHIDPQLVVQGEKATKPVNPTKENRYFNCWYTDENQTEEYSFDKPVNEDITLYAGWYLNAGIGIYNRSNPNTDPYNYSCGTIDISSAGNNLHIVGRTNYALSEKPVAFIANPADGYTFKGWYEGMFGNSHFIEKPSSTLLSNQNPYAPSSIDEAKALCAVFECSNHQWKQKIQKASSDQSGCKYDVCRICGTENKEKVVPISSVNNIALDNTSFTYTGKAIEPIVSVTDANGKQLVLAQQLPVQVYHRYLDLRNHLLLSMWGSLYIVSICKEIRFPTVGI